MSSGSNGALWALVLLLGAPFGCDSGTPAGSGGDGSVGDAQTVEDAAGDARGRDGSVTDGRAGDGGAADGESDSCIPLEVNCNDVCGPVTDFCTGKTYECGTCGDGMVCDVDLHVCVEAKGTCTDLGAECGSIRNACGNRLDCGECPAGQECDPDTNMCITCIQVTCADLGKQCGQVWLGCGPKSNLTDCDAEAGVADCGAGNTCNTFYSVCEPQCTPSPTVDLCAAAASGKGVECGAISDGCGGVVDCGGCPAGKSCGVGGIANRCDVPPPWPECLAAGRECGTLTSKCGIQIDCGDCAPGDVCNTNGKCGAPCTPKTCPVDFASQCGVQLDDGCGGKLDCKCGSQDLCNTGTPGDVGSCVPKKTCGDYNATGQPGETCSNGPATSFPRGDGTDLTCPCGAGGLCIDAFKVVAGTASGSCCVNANSCSGTNACSVENSCTKAPINCCKNNQYCASGSNTCVNKKTCADYTNRGNGDPCSTKAIAFFDDGTGKALKCSCLSGGVCQDPDPTDESPGTCCVNSNSCDGSSCSVTNSCTGDTIGCCGPAEYCDSGSDTCKPLKTCADYTDGQSGSDCSTGPYFSDSNGGLLTCGCAAGGVCVESGGGPQGTCCFNTASCGGTTACSVTNTCTGNPINCCAGNEYCDANTCKTKNTCGTYTDRKLGSKCSDVNTAEFPVGDGSFLKCTCSKSGGFNNIQCTGDSSSKAGTCVCSPRACDCSISGQSDYCGGTLSCGCTGGKVCFNKTCCTPYQCPTGNAGDECGIAHSQCGQNITCQCQGPAYNTCGGGGVINKCGCTPDTCRGRVGVFDNLCGGTITCSG